jgi:hypothetical protein
VFVETYRNGVEFIRDLDGVSWHKAPAPPRNHPHTVQTRGFIDGVSIFRCPCGATNIDGVWLPAREPRTAPRRPVLVLAGPGLER